MSDRKIYEQFLSHCDNGFIMLDDDCLVTRINNAVNELTGFSPEELDGSSLAMLFDGFTAEKICSIYECFGCRHIQQTISGELLHKDEPSKYVQITVNCTGDQGSEYRWLLVKNKSFRKEMERKVRKSRLMLSTALESLPFDFWINDAENRTFMQNTISKELWGDQKGGHPEDVGANDEITRKWVETTERALTGEIVSGELEYIIGGRRKVFRNILAPVKDNDEILGIVGMNIDISDLKEALEMRDMLLKEVYHRVKNNLQMISSIIHLESINLPENENSGVFDDLVGRIDAVSLVHEKLYTTETNNIIHTSDYIRDLVDHIISGVKNGDVVVDYDLDDVDLEIDRLLILGLIINELVTNSVKYAFTESKRHILRVTLKKQNNFISAIISDNGPGLLSGETSSKSGRALGFKMIDVFLKQLDGELERSSNSAGVKSKLVFPVKKTEA